MKPKQALHVQVARKHMNTTFDLRISCDSTRALAAQTVLLEAHETVSRLERALSEFLPDSPVAQLNQASPFERIAFPAPAMALLELSLHLGAQTEGAFDVGAKGARAVFPRFGFDIATQTAWRCGPGERLSFAAIGKGFALDEVRSHIEREGFGNFLLNAGGSSQIFSGFSANGEPWQWAWAWNKDANGVPMGIGFSHSAGEPISLGVSGTMEQGHHLIDPRSGKLANASQTALVAARSAATSDALSTALFVSGWEQAHKLTEPLEVPALAHISPTGIPSWNGRFQTLWGGVMSVLLALLLPLRAFGDEDIDLSDLGMQDFAPYAVHRDPIWILLPLAALGLVFLHLKNSRPARAKREES